MTRAPVIILALLVLALSFGIVFRYSNETHRAQSDLNQERYLRMVAEENGEKLKSQVTSLQADLAKRDSKIQVLEKSGEQLKAINGDLKARLDKDAEIMKNMDVKIQELLKLSGATPQ